MSDRVSSFEEFWPYYLSQHRNATARRLHFVGTTGFVASLAGSAAIHPLRFPAAMAAFGALLKSGLTRGESERPSLGHVAGMLGLGAVGSPVLFPAGVVFAYGCAWVGHFGFEGNVPATFQYPLWSLVGDFKMWSHMVRGRLWSGDPLEELGLADPYAEAAPASGGHVRA